jgi:hypothetical protein
VRVYAALHSGPGFIERRIGRRSAINMGERPWAGETRSCALVNSRMAVSEAAWKDDFRHRRTQATE